MQLLDDIRALRTGEARVEAEDLDVARRALSAEIERSRPRPVRAKRRWGLSLGLGVGSVSGLDRGDSSR